jgi:adenosylcobinamide kinase/adenosylcobinamide-phosphate guanylyltransferase
MKGKEGKIILVGGGVRSGKSRFAVDYAHGLGVRRTFVATAQAFDAEMEDRIVRHRTERGQDFVTVEEPLQLARVLGEIADADVVVVDCLTLWLSNLLLSGRSGDDIARAVDDVMGVLRLRRYHTLLVSNEVGMGIVPESALGRTFRDCAGAAHQRIASQADEVYLATMGLVLRLLPGPVTVVRPQEQAIQQR